MWVKRLIKVSDIISLRTARNFGTFYRGNISSNMFINSFSSLRRTFSTNNRAVIPTSYTKAELEVVDSIKMLIEKRIRPVVQQDGGDVDFVSFDPATGFVYVRLSGACVGCIQSDTTLKHMIQGMLCHYIDEITAVYNCNEDGYVVSGNSANE
ncbi:ankyrin repeat domain-containing protein [Theileria equi strain WA]|uniref:Ankyrin repeat domain-containing protein n=1 Tax=Theileria equi strain WA TaxID=1537102 RepID=L0B1B0_THEEQ|nr:ankyrin repeat domain-containing protein [Theileria equi strain WA]AFZ81298.1 ankyrin repeat domain-containing protein [Theileria equi strain WA]|eukprot:XP_004830964.1 ankyrin repeat domain-containing protein [Theileria equi strain WA]